MTMQLLGTRVGGVAGLSAAATTHSTFASLSCDGTVCLWDVRLKNRNYMTVPTRRGRGSSSSTAEGTEVLFAADRDLVVALCGSHVRFVDVRRQMDTVAEYTHTSEVVAFVSGSHPVGQQTTLVIDEEGRIMPLDLVMMRPSEAVEGWVFGRHTTVPSTNPSPGFGELTNYCCGLGLVDVPAGSSGLVAGEEEGESEGADTFSDYGESRQAAARHALVAIGMDGKGCLYRSPDRTLPVTISFESLLLDGPPQLVNPPLLTCCGFHGDRIAVGKANGTYELLAVATDGCSLEELMAAPGHARNGLCCVHWAQGGRHLLTVSLCGQATLWSVSDFLEDEEGVLDMPEVLAAMDQRECVGSATAVVNGGTELCTGQYLLGDTEGHVTLSTYL